MDDGLAVLVEGKVVPDVAAIDLDGEVHVLAVIGRQRRSAEGEVQAGEPLAPHPAQEGRDVIGVADRERGQERVGGVADEISHLVLLAARVLVRHGFLAARHGAVLENARGVGDALHEDAAECIEVQVHGRALERGGGFAPEKSPAEDVVLSLPRGQRLVGRQVEVAVHMAYPRDEQSFAHQARLHRADGAQASLAATVAFDALGQLAIALGDAGQQRVAALVRTQLVVGRRQLHLARGRVGGRPIARQQLLDPAGIGQRLPVFLLGLLAALIRDHALESREASQIYLRVASLAPIFFYAREQDRERGRDAIRLQVVAVALHPHGALGLGDGVAALAGLGRALFRRDARRGQRRQRALRGFHEDLLGARAIVGQPDEGVTVGVRLRRRARPVGLAEDKRRPRVGEIHVEQALLACLGDALAARSV